MKICEENRHKIDVAIHNKVKIYADTSLKKTFKIHSFSSLYDSENLEAFDISKKFESQLKALNLYFEKKIRFYK